MLHLKKVPDTNTIINNQENVRQLLRKISPLPSFGINDRAVFLELFAIRENIMRISDYAADIAEIVIDRAYRPEES